VTKMGEKFDQQRRGESIAGLGVSIY